MSVTKSYAKLSADEVLEHFGVKNASFGLNPASITSLTLVHGQNKFMAEEQVCHKYHFIVIHGTVS
jgi:hypothetical protein